MSSRSGISKSSQSSRQRSSHQHHPRHSPRTPQKYEPSDLDSEVTPTRALHLSSDKETIYSSVKCDAYLKAAELAYQKLLDVRPRLSFLFSLAEWRHVHALLLYARVWDCELSAARLRRPTEFRIKVPKTIKVLAPLAAVLRSIGIVEDDGLGAIYIPVARKLKPGYRYRQPDPEDVTEFLEWTQYDWKGSWALVEAERKVRKAAAAEHHINPPDPLAPSERRGNVADWESQAVELWLRYDDDLWFSYQQASSILARRASFVEFPTSPKGSYAWLIPRQDDEDGRSSKSKELGPACRMPRKTLPKDDWIIAILFDMSALPHERTCTWYHRIQAAKPAAEIMDHFVGSAIR